MPQVDLETLVSSVCAGGSDRKIACETLADDPTHDSDSRHDQVPISAADFPPESFFLSKEAELEWLNENAFYERKESHKGNSTSSSANLNPSVVSNPNSNSQRISLKHKASIIGLPKPQKRCFNEAKSRRTCKIANTRLIPKRVGSRFKSDSSLPEPSSPKVSCMGRVRSKRDRSRRVNRQKSGRSDPFKDNKQIRVKKPGFFASFRAIFRTGGGCKDVSASGAHAPPRMDSPPTTLHDIRTRLPRDYTEAVTAELSQRNSSGSRRSFERSGEPVRAGLGGVKRFASGRRADLVVDVDVA